MQAHSQQGGPVPHAHTATNTCSRGGQCLVRAPPHTLAAGGAVPRAHAATLAPSREDSASCAHRHKHSQQGGAVPHAHTATNTRSRGGQCLVRTLPRTLPVGRTVPRAHATTHARSRGPSASCAPRHACLQVVAFHCKECARFSERREPHCRDHTVTRVTTTKRWWQCLHCNAHFSTLGVIFPSRRCPRRVSFWCLPIQGVRLHARLHVCLPLARGASILGARAAFLLYEPREWPCASWLFHFARFPCHTRAGTWGLVHRNRCSLIPQGS